MPNSSPSKVSAFLDDIAFIDPERHQLICAIRALVLSLDGSICEEIKYGGILFSASKPFCGIFSYTEHVSVEFGQGAQLVDEYAMLEGKGKFRRHIKLTNEQDIATKQLRAYVAQAFAARKAQNE